MTVTIPTTSVGPVIAYLVSAIEAQISTDDAGSSILLSLADPGNATDLEPEIIAVGRITRSVDPNSIVGSGGQGFLEEKYDIDCMVSVWTGSSDSDGATAIQVQQIQRAWQLYSYVETAIRLDPSLGDLVQLAYPLTALQDDPTWTQDPVGLLVEIVFQIHVEHVS